MTAQGFVPDDPDEWAKGNQAPAAAWQPDDPEEWAKGQGDQNAHLLKSSVKVAPTQGDFEKNMAFHKAKREASPVYQSIIEKPENEHPFHRLARITTPTMLNAVDAAKSLVEHFDPKLEKSRFFAQKAMDALAAGTYSQAGTFLQAARMAKGEASFSDLIHKGILSGPEVLFGAGPGKDSRTFNSDVLDEMGVKNPWLKYGGGFALDIAANPVNFMKGVGLLPLGKAAKMYTEAMQEARVMGTAAPNWEEMAKNGNRTARLIVKTLAKEGGEDALNFGTTTAEQVEKGHAGFGGLQIPGMKRVNMTKLRFQMSEDAWAKLAEESPELAGKIKPGEPIPKDVMKELLKVKGDEAFKDITLHPSTTRKSFSIPVPDIHNPAWEMQGLPRGASVPLAKALTATNRYLREFNPEYLKPEASALQNAYGKARKVSSDFMDAMDKTFHRYPKPVMEGKLADPRIFDDTVMITRMALNQKGDLTRETLDALYDLQTRVGGDKNVVLKMARSLKLDKSAPDTYRAIETALSHRVPNADFQGVRSSLEDATRTITPNRDLPNEWELRNFGTTDPAKIRQQIDDAVAVQRGEWGNDQRQAVAEALASGEVGKEEAQAALAAIDAQGASIARDAEDKLRAVDNLERNLQRHRDELFSLRAAERQAAYSGTPEQVDRFGKMAGETEQSLGPNGWGETYRKIFGKDIHEVLPEPTGQPRMAFPSASQRLRAAQDDVARIQESLRSAAEEQRALAAAMEAAPSPTNEALVRLERANQRSAELQAQLQQRVKLISDLDDRVRNEGDTDAMIQKVQAALDKQHEVDTAEEIAQLEKHPAMARPSTTLKSVRQERARLLRERPAAFRDESFAPEGETVLEHLKARYGDDPEYYKAMLEQRAAAHDRAEFRKSAARAEREGAKGLREAVKVAEPAAPEKPVLAAPAWRMRTVAFDPAAVVDELRSRYPKAGETVGGLKVRSKVDNTGSISASLNDYEELGGVREISRSEFTAPKYDPSKATTVDSRDRALALAEEIRKSGEITPLIVAIDKDGPYILEGGHRFDALDILGVDKFPAVIVRDLEDLPAAKDASEEIITAPGKTWHDFTLHPPDIQARIEAGQGVETGFVDATGKFFTREEVAQQGLKMEPPKNANRPAIGKPRVPLKGSGLPVPAPKPVASAVDLSSFGMNNPPDIRAFIANREAGGSQLGLAMTGAQDLRGAIPEPGSTGMHEYQTWLSKTLENPTVASDISEEVARDLVRLSGQGWASRRAMRDMVDSWIHTEDGRQKIVKFMAEYFPHVKDVTAAYSSPLAVVLGGPPKGALGRPGFATARKFRDTFDDIQQAAKLATGKDLLVEDVATTLFNRAADSIHFQVHNDMLNRMLSSMGLSGKEIQAALIAEGITDIPNARAAANIVNAHYWMRKMGYPNEDIARVEKLNKKLIDLGVWNMTGNPADPTAAEGVMSRLAAIARTGDFREAKGITFDETGKAFSDLPDGIKKRLMRAVGVTDEAALIDPAQHVPGTSLKDAAAKIIRDVNQTVKERDVLAPRLKLFMTKGDLAQLADVPDFVNVMSVAKGLRESDMKDVGTTLVNLDPATIPNFKQLDQFGVNYYLLPEQLAQHINGGVKTFMDDSGPRGLISRWMHGATNIWKQSVTTIFPEFHLRNIMTNMYQLHVYAGVDDPALFWQARKIQLGLPGAFDRGDGSILTNAEVLRLAQKYGVAGHGYFGEDVKAILDPRKNAHISRAKGVIGAPLSVGRDVGRFWEENARVGGFLHFLREGYSPYSASMLVKKYLFDYSELSPTERNTFRLFIPFYAWMRKNIPLQLGEIIRNPATASVSRDIQHAVSGLVNGQDLTPEQFDNLPSWLKPMLPILYRNRHDKPKITAIAGKVSPMSDPMQLGQDIGERGLLGGVGSYLWGGSNPVLKEGTKQAFSVDVESGRKLFENPIHKVPLHLPFGLAGPVGRTLQLPVGKGLVMIPERAGSILQNLRGVSFMNSTMKDAAEDTTAAQNVETVLKNLAGLRSYDVDLQKNYQMEGRNQKKAIEEEAPFTMDGQINFKSPLIREIMKRAKDSAKGVPPMTPEERKAFNERLRKAQEKFQQQRTQRP